MDGIRYVRLARPTAPERQPVDGYLDDWAKAAAPWVSAERPEVLHVHSGHRGYETALVGQALARSAGLPLVYEVRGFFETLWTRDVAWAERGELTWRRRNTDTRCMLAADAVVTLSDTMRAVIVARGVAADRVHVIPNGVDVDAFRPRARNLALVARHGLADKFVFGYVSNLDHFREGHELLIEAAIRLRKQRGFPPSRSSSATVIDASSSSGSPVDWVVATQSSSRVGCRTAEVLDYYALLDVFVIPRVDELAARLVTPLKPYEAMAAGRPLLVSDLEALRGGRRRRPWAGVPGRRRRCPRRRARGHARTPGAARADGRAGARLGCRRAAVVTQRKPVPTGLRAGPQRRRLTCRGGLPVTSSGSCRIARSSMSQAHARTSRRPPRSSPPSTSSASSSCSSTPASTTTSGCPTSSSASSACPSRTSTWASARAATRRRPRRSWSGSRSCSSSVSPRWSCVYGDVNSTVAAALVAAKLHIPVAHVEAGLRSFDMTMPEEVNRRLTDQLSDLLLVTSPDARRPPGRRGRRPSTASTSSATR